jgi:ubiquinone/menaquinone biosynthesis C-methylase UbiE
MADVYATIAAADQEVQERLAGVLERRAANSQQQAMLRGYLADLTIPAGSAVLDVGCGTGPVSRYLAGLAGVGSVTGVDPSPLFLARARELSATVPHLTFLEADGRCLPFEAGTFNVVVFHTTLSHVPAPEQALAEAFRVLAPGGLLAVFDGDYTTTTLATGAHDPLQACADAAMAALVHDRWLIPRLPTLVTAAGFTVQQQRSFGFVETSEPDYMLSFADRGADVLAAEGRIGVELATALKDEARRRAAAGSFFGYIAYGSLIASKPF